MSEDATGVESEAGRTCPELLEENVKSNRSEAKNQAKQTHRATSKRLTDTNELLDRDC